MLASQSLKERVLFGLEQIRPFLLEDGGDIELVEITPDLVVKVEFKGACSSCSMNQMTFKAGVEDAIRKVAPEVIRVEEINSILA